MLNLYLSVSACPLPPPPQVPLPEGLLLDDQAVSVKELQLAPSDLAAALLAVGLAAADIYGECEQVG